jgi:hypothetical protein
MLLLLGGGPDNDWAIIPQNQKETGNQPVSFENKVVDPLIRADRFPD